MKLPGLRPFGLIGQIVAILLFAVIVEFAASTALYERASEFSVRDDEARRLAEHIVVARQLLERAPPERRAAIARTLSTDHYSTSWTPAVPNSSAHSLTLLRSQVIAWEPSLGGSDLRLDRATNGLVARISGGLVLRDGSWLAFRTEHSLSGAAWWQGRIALAAGLALLVTGSASLLLRALLRPLRRLARAADHFGAGKAEQVQEAGPIEIRHLIAAFNGMQSRIERLIAERLQALAAVGHDLRTPLARMRLRIDGIADPELRATIADDVIEMEAMVTSLLAYLGGEGDPEKPMLTDIAVLCATLADDAADQGHAVDYRGPDHCEHLVRRVNLKRAVSNLVENAVHYGSAITISLDPRPDWLVIAVADDGPGIPEGSLQSVLEPFVRLDAARRRDTIGLGLGLAIASRVVAAEGGRLALSNRPEGGLCAEIWLPRAAPASFSSLRQPRSSPPLQSPS